MALLSKITLGGVTYDLKDAQARENITTLLGGHAVEALGAAAWQAVAANISGEGLVSAATVKSYVDAQVGAIHNFDVKIYENLPQASEETMYIIGLVKNAQAASGEYIEYITIKDAESNYSWEAIGSTKTDLTGYVSGDTTIAGIDLNDNITAEELQYALGLGALAYKNSATGTVAGQVISGVKGSATTAGSLTGEMAYTATAVASTGNFTPSGDVTGSVVATGTIANTVSTEDAAATLTRGDYTPSGDVTVTPATGTVAAVASVGTQASFVEGAFTPASLDKTDKAFAVEGIVAAIDPEDAECLVFTAAGTGNASLINDFSGGTKAADTFTANELPTTTNASVVTGIQSASFTGAKEEGLKVTGATYAKVNGVSGTFTGTEAAIDATFAGAQGAVNVSGSYDKANLGTVTFAGSEIEVAVGDITVAAKDVTVE